MVAFQAPRGHHLCHSVDLGSSPSSDHFQHVILSLDKSVHLLEPPFLRLQNGGFPYGSAGKESTCSAGDVRDAGSIPGLGRSPGGGNGNLFWYSCLGNPGQLTKEPGGL